MHKGMIPVLVSLFFLAIFSAPAASANIYKVVDEDGNVTYTDQKPLKPPSRTSRPSHPRAPRRKPLHRVICASSSAIFASSNRRTRKRSGERRTRWL